jgi:hypothetical protein
MKVGTILENSRWKIKIFAPPKEHGPPHVHVIAKGENAEVKILLENLEVIGSTRFSKKTVTGIVRFIYENYEHISNCWEALHGKKETKPKKSTKKN